MNILVINAGSSSIKYKLYDMPSGNVLAKGGAERIGINGSNLVHKVEGRDDYKIDTPMPDHVTAMRLVLGALTDPAHGVIRDMSQIDAVGHRVVHGGQIFSSSVLLDEDARGKIEGLSDLAPLHNPPALMGIEACLHTMPGTPMAAVFDTAFHQTMPDYAYMYALPYEYYTDHRVRRYGMHGTSHKYVSRRAAEILGRDIADLKIVTCHLGNGASIAAVDGGKSVDTSMGLTPLAGIMMGTRCGDVDPAIAQYIMRKTDMDIFAFGDVMNKQSGLLGVSGLSSDMRDITVAAREGNKRAALAQEMFCYQIRKYIGAYAAAMGGLDCVVITAGIGENTPLIRERLAEGMEFLGLSVDSSRNDRPAGDYVVSPDGARCAMVVVATDEERVIALETMELL